MIHYVKGNLLDSDCDYICHQVNCQGVMGSGIARQIRERWPEVYDSYRRAWTKGMQEDRGYDTSVLLGKVDVARITDTEQYVINMFAQNACGYDGARYTSYDAFSDTLVGVRLVVPFGKSIGFPKNIGCGLGGGNWTIISTLIEIMLGEDYDVYIYEYDPEVK